jgi:hypothetical protein
VTGWAGATAAGQAGCGIWTATGAGGVGVATGVMPGSAFDLRSKSPDDATDTQDLDLQLRGASMWMRLPPITKEKEPAWADVLIAIAAMKMLIRFMDAPENSGGKATRMNGG